MEYKEYGSKNKDIIILLHGGGLSWWNYIDDMYPARCGGTRL